MRTKQYNITGTISYVLACPKAPDVAEWCDPVAACEGHIYTVPVALYVEAPDEDRAMIVALKKLATPYPFPLFDNGDEVIELVEHGTPQPKPAADYLPGFGPGAARGAYTNLRHIADEVKAGHVRIFVDDGPSVLDDAIIEDTALDMDEETIAHFAGTENDTD